MSTSSRRHPLRPTSEAGRAQLLRMSSKELASHRAAPASRLYRALGNPWVMTSALLMWALGMVALISELGSPAPTLARELPLAVLLGLGAFAVVALVWAATHSRLADNAWLLEPLQTRLDLCEEVLKATQEVGACRRFMDQLIGAKRELIVADAQAVLSIAQAWRAARQKERAALVWQDLTSPVAAASA